MRAASICLLVIVATVSGAAAQEKTITLPAAHDYGTLKPATQSDLAQTQCQFCHSTDYIVMQPRGDATQWAGVVTKMIKIYGAPISESDAKAITEYLTKNYGPVK
jgi:cytochrome c5